MIILKTVYCKVSLIFLSQIFNNTLAIEKTKSYQMHIYTVSHTASYEVMMVGHINPILKIISMYMWEPTVTPEKLLK